MVSKRFDWSLRKSNVFKTGWCNGINQLLQFWNERFMPNTFENPEGLSFENMENFVDGFENPFTPLPFGIFGTQTIKQNS